jgi:hypothetical protein
VDGSDNSMSALTDEDLKNLVLFMERAPCTGREAMGWTQTYQALHAEIARRASAKPPAIPEQEKP